MKNLKLSIIACLAFLGLHAQNENHQQTISEGVDLHDQGKYAEAIALYDQVLAEDSTNVLALGEKALTLYLTKSYEELIPICKKAINAHPGDENLKTIYSTYGNTLDALGRGDDALEVYAEGISMFPDHYLLHFNKGITLYLLKEIDEAEIAFQNAVKINPHHASSFHALAHISLAKNNTIPAILCFLKFFEIEPISKRAIQNFSIFNELRMKGVSGNGSNKININIDPAVLSGEKEPEAENNFQSVELVFQLSGALMMSKEMKKKTEAERLAASLNTLFSVLKEKKEEGKGFYWDYMSAYFIDIMENDHLDVMSNMMYLYTEKKSLKWINKHMEELAAYMDYVENYEWNLNK